MSLESAPPPSVPPQDGNVSAPASREQELLDQLARERESHARERDSWDRERALLTRPSSFVLASAGGASFSPVGVFWDFENCSPPLTTNASALVRHFRELFQPHGSLKMIRCYQDVGSQPVFAANLRAGLEASGVEVRDAGRWGRKDVSDHHIMADMLLFAVDNPPPATVVLISGDKDFSYLLACLRNRKYDIVLVESPVGAAEELKSSAIKVYKWKDILRDAGGSKTPLTAMPGVPTPIAASVPAAHTTATSTFTPPRRPRSNSDPMSPDARVVAPRSVGFTGGAGKTLYKPTPTFKASQSSPSMVAGTPTKASAAPAGPPVLPRSKTLFKPLVEVLKTRPTPPPYLRSAIAPLVMQQDPTAYAQVGAKTWKEYLEIAVASGVVSIGPGDKLGMEWVTLNDESSFMPLGVPPTPAKPVRSASSGPDVLASPTSLGRKQMMTALVAEAQSANASPLALFQPLIEVLSSLPATPPPLRYIASNLLRSHNPSLHEQTTFKSYVTKAQELGIVTLGGGARTVEKGEEWISLSPKHRLPPSALPAFDGPAPPLNVHTEELFAPLIEVMRGLPLPSDPTKIPAVSRSRVGTLLALASPDYAELVNCDGKNSYLDLARRMGVVRIGTGKEPGSDYVVLKKEYRVEKREEDEQVAATSGPPPSTPSKSSGPASVLTPAPHPLSSVFTAPPPLPSPSPSPSPSTATATDGTDEALAAMLDSGLNLAAQPSVVGEGGTGGEAGQDAV